MESLLAMLFLISMGITHPTYTRYVYFKLKSLIGELALPRFYYDFILFTKSAYCSGVSMPVQDWSTLPVIIE